MLCDYAAEVIIAGIRSKMSNPSTHISKIRECNKGDSRDKARWIGRASELPTVLAKLNSFLNQPFSCYFEI